MEERKTMGMEAAVAELERVQNQILERISKLELNYLPQNDVSAAVSVTSPQSTCDTQARLSNILRSNSVNDFLFKKVPADYYDWSLDSRRDILAAASIDHLCKSIVLVRRQLNLPAWVQEVEESYYKDSVASTIIPGLLIDSQANQNFSYRDGILRKDGVIYVGSFGDLRQKLIEEAHSSVMGGHSGVKGTMKRLQLFFGWDTMLKEVNTQAAPNVIDCSDRNNSKYYVVVVQYTARFNAETVKNFCICSTMARYQKRNSTVMRLAPEETSISLTGYEHNAVTCIGMKTDIPVILDEAIVKLNPDFFWLGGGEIDLKLGIKTPEFIKFVKPFIVSCS
ncbi:hypothetical protein JRO89_XS13G0055000 [Xanthoceras sorbifolium]|uniref:YbaK/aminoacyl-tRNA synthetase-associated domain-containing protein n=1 Tax=Xanthoceras sorbifolium TaxID=99658 RepID=A0ABQ8H6R9_9ROSI|nr:hypothetical protein JRO89_XS13G0055000 [Xanthoceras sorbifolium]